MDERELQAIINKCKYLKFKFNGVYAANNFPLLIKPFSFQIINASPANHAGTHWLVLCRRGHDIIFADPLGFSMTVYTLLYCRCLQFYNNVIDFSYPIQPINSNLCGMFCIFLAHVILSNQYPHKLVIDVDGLRKFITTNC